MRWLTSLALAVSLPQLLAATPAGAISSFELLYPTTNGVVTVPAPFGRLLDDIRDRSKGAKIEVAFVPLGRSLQRLAADPKFFQSPRIVAAVTEDGSLGPMLKDRLFVGYQPAVGSIEIIAFDADEGRFVFQELLNYGSKQEATLIRHDDSACAACHQSHGPIFSASPWQETNSNPEVVQRLAPSYEGLPVKVDFDGVDGFDRAVRRAARLQAAARLWKDGCRTRSCRAALITAALSASGSATLDSSGNRDRTYEEELSSAWPSGLMQPSSKIPDYDPLRLVLNGTSPAAAIETTGLLNPETPREAELLWGSGPSSATKAVELIAELFGIEQIAAASSSFEASQIPVVTDAVIGLADSNAASPVLDGALPDRDSLALLLKQAMPAGGLP